MDNEISIMPAKLKKYKEKDTQLNVWSSAM